MIFLQIFIRKLTFYDLLDQKQESMIRMAKGYPLEIKQDDIKTNEPCRMWQKADPYQKCRFTKYWQNL